MLRNVGTSRIAAAGLSLLALAVLSPAQAQQARQARQAQQARPAQQAQQGANLRPFLQALRNTSYTPGVHSGQYGAVTYLGGARPIYTPGHSGQYGSVTYFQRPSYQNGGITIFGGAPYSPGKHNGQYGGVTYLGGVRPIYTPGHSGQYGSVTYFTTNIGQPIRPSTPQGTNLLNGGPFQIEDHDPAYNLFSIHQKR